MASYLVPQVVGNEVAFDLNLLPRLPQRNLVQPLVLVHGLPHCEHLGKWNRLVHDVNTAKIN